MRIGQRLLGFVKLFVDMQALGPAAAQKVQRPAAHDQAQPGQRRTQRGAIVARAAPDMQITLLQHIFGPVLMAQNAQRQPKHPRRRQVVQAFERRLFARRNTVQQFHKFLIQVGCAHGTHCERQACVLTSPFARRAGNSFYRLWMSTQAINRWMQPCRANG